MQLRGRRIDCGWPTRWRRIFPSGAERIARRSPFRICSSTPSGCAARLVDPPPLGRREFEHEICSDAARIRAADDVRLQRPRVHPAGVSRADWTPAAASIAAAQFEEDRRRGPCRPVTFSLASERSPLAAPTRPMDEDPRRGRLLVGEVHDNYAAALGGAAGHAGLFGTAAGVGAFARAMLRAARGDSTIPPPLSPALVARAVTKSTVARQLARARLGYDAADFVLRHADVRVRLRPRRLHRHVAVDRPGTRSLFRPADQPRLRRRHAGGDANRPSRFHDAVVD